MNRKLLLTGLLVFAAAIIPAQAVITTMPPGLGFGDTYRLIFVTDGTRDAGSTFISTYDSFVTAEADAIPALLALGTSWATVGSTPFDDAQDNTGTAPGGGVPIFGLDGVKVADDYDDLWDGTLDAGISTTPTDSVVIGASVWTGTDASGIGIADAELGSGSGEAEAGLSGATGASWIDAFTDPQTESYRLYAISGELTAVPEPSQTITLLIGLAGVILRRRRPAS